MTNSDSTRQRLLDVGTEMAKEKELRALTVRSVARQAEVNLGSFVYHFGNRDTFLQALVENWYSPLFEQVRLKSHLNLSPREELRATIRLSTHFILQNRQFISQLLMDALDGEKTVRAFVPSVFERHIQVVLTLIKRAQAAGELCRANIYNQFVFIVSAIGLPIPLGQLIFCQEPQPSGSHQQILPLAPQRSPHFLLLK